MNKIIKKEKENIFFVFYGKLPPDICEYIIDLIYPKEALHYKRILCNEIKLKSLYQKDYDEKYDSYYIKSWSSENISLWNNISYEELLDYSDNIISKKSFMDKKYNENIIAKKTFCFSEYCPPFLLTMHDKYCGCEPCFSSIDYPRIVYLYTKVQNKIRGEFSRKINNWSLFEYYLTSTKGGNTVETINDIEDRYGFSSTFDRLNKYHRISNKTYHPLLKNNKNKMIQIQQIWRGILLNQ